MSGDFVAFTTNVSLLSYSEEILTGRLRWKAGALQQQVAKIEYEMGYPKSRVDDWRDVPHVD